MKPAEMRVLLTGASGGIGQAMTRRLAGAGAAVLGVGRGEAPAGRAEPTDIDRGRLEWLQADLTAADASARVAAAAAAWGANVVVHAAGVPAFGAMAHTPPSQMRSVLHTNLLAPMALTQALLPHLARQREAQVVFVGSALGRIGVPGFSVYGASKAGLHGFAEALRRELAGTPVRVKTLGPRSTRTGFNGDAVEAFNQATGTAMDSPRDVADALVRLLEGTAPERYIGFPERLAVRLNGALGAWLDSGFRKHRRHLEEDAGPTHQSKGSLA
ncbi:MAG: SDR family oxidoreductase [Betaproteobacteria bacterium]|nr:SDR family oxidoreductase [Betaproteobacteria bacterium]MCC6247390.1 SDR family oxidoreductase [Rubrivivax sp.]MCL4695722.1 SDR family oxidoreductase [Burkholderiaceae bacterium]